MSCISGVEYSAQQWAAGAGYTSEDCRETLWVIYKLITQLILPRAFSPYLLPCVRTLFHIAIAR